MACFIFQARFVSYLWRLPISYNYPSAAIAVESLPMKPIPWRVQLGVVAAGYMAVVLVAAALLFMRHMQYVNNPADAVASGGMWAGGDLILGLLSLVCF